VSKIFLDDVVYHPTFNCNLTCRGCINYSDHLETRSIPDEKDWKRDLDILFDRFDVGHLEIAGGESLMFSDIQPFINHLLTKPVKRFTLATNGLLLYKHDWIKDLLKSDQRFKIIITCQGHPFQESVYIKNFCESLGKFFNIKPEKFKKDLRRYFLSGSDVGCFKFYDSNKNQIYIDQIGIKNMHSPGFWRYPLMDKNELPIQFNNSKEEAYKSCKCYVSAKPAIHMKAGKLYKCSVTALLLTVVKAKNLYDSTWEHLEQYQPYNLLKEHDPLCWDKMFVPEDVCSRCPVGNAQWDRNKTDLHSKIVFGPSIIK
jgi:hypothetical protein